MSDKFSRESSITSGLATRRRSGPSTPVATPTVTIPRRLASSRSWRLSEIATSSAGHPSLLHTALWRTYVREHGSCKKHCSDECREDWTHQEQLGNREHCHYYPHIFHLPVSFLAMSVPYITHLRKLHHSVSEETITALMARQAVLDCCDALFLSP